MSTKLDKELSMTIEKKLARIFNLNDETWLCHANPWSVWTRYSVLPILILAFWSRVWIGWYSLIPVVIALGWMFLNPVFFHKPQSTQNWASKSVLGERVWMNRVACPVPAHHMVMPHILNLISCVGMILSIWAVITLSIWMAVFGVVLTYLGKSWYLDRMVWLYEDMKHKSEYAKWLY